MLKNAKIYKISSPRIDKFYIGSTRDARLKARFYQHCLAYWRYESGAKQSYLSSFDVVKYDDAQITLIEAFEAESNDMLLAREQYWIDKYAGQTVNRGTAFKHGSFRDEEPEICEEALSGPPSPSPSPIADSPIDKEYPRGRERAKKKEARPADKPDPRARAVSRTPVPSRETEALPSMLTKSSPKSVVTKPKKSAPKTIRGKSGKAVAATAATPMTQTQAKAVAKVMCCCGSSLLASSLSAHYKTAKHARGLAAMAKV